MKREGRRTTVFTRRALVIMAGQIAALGALGVKLYRVQVEEGARYATLAENNRISARLLAPTRGRILDRFGTVLAGNSLNWRALLLAEETTDVPATLKKFNDIVPLADHDLARIDRDMKHSRRFIPVMLRDFLTWDDMAKIEVAAPDLPGVLVDVGTTRRYPFGADMAHVVGYVAPPSEDDSGDDPVLALPGMRVGRAGAEKSRDEELRGEAGQVQMEVNSVGRVIRELDRTEGQPGDEITLTIDAVLQQSTLAHLGDKSASAVVMDCTNGEVLAMATNPSFDPSLFDAGISEAQWEAWTNDRRTPLINKAMAGDYPPGSTFKMCVGLAALHAGALTPDDRIVCPGYIDFGNTRFHCWKKGGHGPLDMHGGLKHSCDVFFYDAARRAGIDAIAEVANIFGLGTELPIDLPGGRSGLIPTPAWRRKHHRHWGVADTIVAGIGQGVILATPLQLATYVSRIATGRAVVPHATRKISGEALPGATADEYPVLDIPEDALALARGGMFAVVNEAGGTAPHARLGMPGIQLAGKTGSSQVRRVSRWAREHGHFNSAQLPWEFRPHALFVCFAPYDAPRYACSVVIEHGNAGADVAAPLARDIMRDVLTRDPARREIAPGQTVVGSM
ncbi:MAG TPA: penicillin-binding protein 2 [Acetobacteraceae bacterium]|nr:penicillin-binding protein 2 [Acetobacteraceae bacterium]